MTEMTLSLFDPNTLLPHRAGIAGLALALDSLSPEKAPLEWEVTEDEVRLAWSGSDREAVEWIVKRTYAVEDGYLDVPALKLDPQARYTFTQGVMSTLLQHNQQRKLDSLQSLSFSVDPAQPELIVSYKPLIDCYYTRDFKDAFTNKGTFKSEITLKGHHLPGLLECFVNGAYKEAPPGFLALLFLPLACGYYKLPNLRSALVIPEVTNLKQSIKRRQKQSGRTYANFCASGAGESGLRFLLQGKTVENAEKLKFQYCEVYQLGGQAWNKNQAYLKQAVHRVRVTDETLNLYKTARLLFPAKVKVNNKGDTWFAVSTVLPWIADNLITDKPWYVGFYEFRKANQLYEREGLVKMTQNLGNEERVVFEAVQGAFSAFLRGQILQAQKQGRKLDYGQVTDKAIYRLQRPSTKQEFASALVNFISQHRSSAARGKGIQIASWIHSDENWRKARDLALLAIATYESKGKADPDISDADLND
ncbi:type I-MYXAN CRISPR-associated Cas8a1/Cmx1 [Synechococcus sp. PCC 7336]|uniref:type I-MYXAN CRISPR-associated Cas8a1/Cmx1 n=1 Tax=Synechococcus sp. PCC 7336 TaxID=195250 RepID=UPI000347BB6D|nr:type I-MYXAN CRISPR-associated Cas8a1/Cmx1 [Synechococcus sp. PCC 7336]